MQPTFRRRIRAALCIFLVIGSVLPLPAASATAAPLALTSADTPWPMFGVTPQHSFAPNITDRGYHNVSLKWTYPVAQSSSGTAVASFGSAITLNNTTAKPDVLGVVFGFTGGVAVAAGNNGSAMWSYPVVGDVFATPVTADLNGDGKLDVLIRSDAGLIEAVTPNITWDGSSYSFPTTNLTEIVAQQLWNRSLTGVVSTNNNLSTPVVADLFGNSTPEILAPAGDRIYLLAGADGSEYNNQTVNGFIVAAPTVIRVSTTWRILVASVNGSFFSNTSLYTLTTFDANLNFLWAQSFPQNWDAFLIYKSADFQLPSPAAGDLDGFGTPDDFAVLTPYEDSRARLRIYHNGSSSFDQNLSLDGLTGSSPAVADLDGDGKAEIVTLSYEAGRALAPNSRAFVEVFAGNGTRIWNATTDELPGTARENTLAPPAIADFDADGVKDIVVFLTDGAMEARSGANGTRIFRHQLLDRASPTEFTAPAIADLDKDGFLDITANAAAVSFSLAELHTAPAEVTLVPAVPEEFQNVSVSATIHNTGNANARNVTVRFSEGGQTLNESFLPVILLGSSAQAQAVINFTGGGQRTLVVTIDPNNTTEEIDEGNNSVQVQVNVTSLYGFHFASPNNRTAVQSGYSYAFILNVVSDGTRDNLVNLSAGSLPSGWSASFSPPNVTIGPAGSPSGTNTSFFAVTTSPTALPGEYDLEVFGVSANSSRNTANFTFTVVIGGEYGVSVFPAFASSNVTAGDFAAYYFDVLNAGNSNDTVLFTNSTPPPGWSVILNWNSVTIAPGQSARVLLQVVAPVNATQGETAAVTLTARSQGNMSKNDTADTLTTVVVPDLIVTDIRFYRADGVEATTGTPRLIVGDPSVVAVDVTNALANAAISSVKVTAWIEGSPATLSGSVPLGGTGTVRFNYTFSASGVQSVTVEADAGNFISESNEANNDRVEQVSVKDASPVGDLTVQGFVLEDGVGVPFPSVNITNLRTGASLDASNGSDGHFVAVITAAWYVDGDLIKIHATDGLDVGNTSVRAYSEDGLVEANITLGLPSPYDFLLIPVGPTAREVPPGSTAAYDVDVLNRGERNNTVLVSVSGLWNPVIIDQNGSAILFVNLPPRGSARIHVQVTPPAGLDPGTFGLAMLNGSAAADPLRARQLSFRTTVAVSRGLSVTGPSSLDLLSGETKSLNITVLNNGNTPENVTLAFVDPQGSGAAVDFTPATLSLPRGGVAAVAVRLTAPPSLATGNYTLNLTATSDIDSSVKAGWPLVLRVTEQRQDFRASFAPSVRLTPGQTRTVNLTLTNNGTVADSYDVTVGAIGGNFTVTLLDSLLEPFVPFALEPGQNTTVKIQIFAPLEVDRESFSLEVAVTGQGPPAKTKSYTITALIGNIHNFRLDSISFGGTPTVDLEVQVNVIVQNIGTRALSGTLPLRLLVERTVIATTSIVSLEVGAKATVTFLWTPREFGTVNLTADVNAPALSSGFYETSFADNSLTQLVSVQPQQAPGLFSPGNLIVWGGFAALLAAAYLVVRRLEERDRDKLDRAPRTKEEVEEDREESRERRRGRGPGGLERL